MKTKDMTDLHLRNRIVWLKRQQIDPYDVVGDHDEFRFTIAQIEEQNNAIDKEIELLESELKLRGLRP